MLTKKTTTRGDNYNELLSLAKSKNLTLRRANKSGEIPMRFEVVRRGASKNEQPFIDNLTPEQVNNNSPLSEGFTLKQFISQFKTVYPKKVVSLCLQGKNDKPFTASDIVRNHQKHQ